MRTLTTLAFAAFVGLCGMASGAEVRVLTVGSTAVAAKAIAADFAKASGHSVSFAVTAPFKIDAELAAKRFDVLIVSVPHMEALATAGTLRKETRTPVARVGVGLVVKAGASLPDISSAEKFKATLLAAKSLTYSDPAIPNLAGGVAATVLGKAGILDALKPKIKYADLGVGADLIKSGEIEMGFFKTARSCPGSPLSARCRRRTQHGPSMKRRCSPRPSPAMPPVRWSMRWRTPLPLATGPPPPSNRPRSIAAPIDHSGSAARRPAKHASGRTLERLSFDRSASHHQNQPNGSEKPPDARCTRSDREGDNARAQTTRLHERRGTRRARLHGGRRRDAAHAG